MQRVPIIGLPLNIPPEYSHLIPVFPNQLEVGKEYLHFNRQEMRDRAWRNRLGQPQGNFQPMERVRIDSIETNSPPPPAQRTRFIEIVYPDRVHRGIPDRRYVNIYYNNENELGTYNHDSIDIFFRLPSILHRTQLLGLREGIHKNATGGSSTGGRRRNRHCRKRTTKRKVNTH